MPVIKSARVRNGSRYAAGAVGGAALLAIAATTIGGFEGVRTSAYRDIVGIPTICFGETRGVRMGDTRTMAECKAMLGAGILEFEAGMRKCLVAPNSIPDKPYIAFTSAAWNIGVGAFCKSSMARLANVGNLRGACDALLAWNKAGGRVVAGLTRRRQEERTLCIEGL